MNRILMTAALVAFAGFSLTTPAARAETLAELDNGCIADVQRNGQTVSHREGLKNTIERLLDCSANGRIDVALVGMGDVPEWVLDVWARSEKDYKEVSISRYGMGLDCRVPEARTDFYRFRTVRQNDEVSETVLQDNRKDKKAAMICTFVNGGPTGQDKALSSVLENLLSAVEEGQITVTTVKYEDMPQKVALRWKKYAPSVEDSSEIRVERFNADTAGGDEIYWKVSYQNPKGGFEQSMLVWRDKMVYCDLNGRIIVE